MSFVKENVYLENNERYNQTHFHNKSGIFNAKQIAFETDSLVDNRFEEHVISNLNGKLRLVFRLMLALDSLRALSLKHQFGNLTKK